jgi:hypothetical protein
VRDIFIGRETLLNLVKDTSKILDERRMLEIIKRMNRVVMILKVRTQSCSN